jgi:AsmA protein
VLVLGGLGALLAAAAALVMVAFDANEWRGEIARLVQDKKSRSLKIEGELSFSLFPFVGVRMGRATLSERESEQVFASVDSVRVHLRPLPLLSKRLVADSVELDGLKVRVVRFKDGRLNIDDLLAGDEKEPPLRFDIGGLRLANGELIWRDERTGRESILSDIDLRSGRLANAANGEFGLTAMLAADAPRLAARLKASGRYRYDLDNESYGGSSLAVDLSGEAADMKGLQMTLSAAGLQLSGAAAGEVDRLRASLKGTVADTAFAARLEAPKLVLTANKTSGAVVEAALSLAGVRRRVDAKAALLGVEGESQSLRVAELTLDVAARQGETTAKGHLASSLTVDLEKRRIALPAFGGEIVITNAQLPTKSVKLPLTGALDADIDGQGAMLHAHARFDESTVAAKANVTRFSPPALLFEVDIDRFDLDRFLPPRAVVAGGGTGPQRPFDFSAIGALDASGIVRIGQLRADRIEADDVRLEVKAAGGKGGQAKAGKRMRKQAEELPGRP